MRLIDLAPHRDDGYDVTDFLAAATNPGLRRQAAALLADIAAATAPFVPDLAPSAKNVNTVDDSSA